MSTELYLSGHCTALASGQEFVTLRLSLYLSGAGGLQNGSGGIMGSTGSWRSSPAWWLLWGWQRYGTGWG